VAAGCAPLAPELRVPSAARALRIRVRIHNDAPIEPDVVAAALKRVDGIYSRADIAIQWTFAEPPAGEASPLFDVVLVKAAPRSASSAGALDGALGHANQAGYRAHAYSEAIRTAAAAFHSAPAYLLGDVVAHELGHLLLPAQGHSAWGIMRPDVLRGGLARSFLPREAEMMARRIRAHAVGRHRPESAPGDPALVQALAGGASTTSRGCRATAIAEWRCPTVEATFFTAGEKLGPDSCR
jgi:hypothetical protein